MATAPLRDRKKAATKDSIARAAIGLFIEHGFEAVTIADIADAVDLSKMTVFNYFPAKEEMFFYFAQSRIPQIGRVIRDRPTDSTPFQAIRSFVRAELLRQAEWTGLHPGGVDYARVILASPTLTARYTNEWQRLENDLVLALSEQDGDLASPPDLQLLLTQLSNAAPPTETEALLSLLSIRSMGVRLFAAQLSAIIRQLVTTNQLRQWLGSTPENALQSALLEFEVAFEQMAHGISSSLT